MTDKKLPRLTPLDAEKELLKAGFTLIRQKGSHRIYTKKRLQNGNTFS